MPRQNCCVKEAMFRPDDNKRAALRSSEKGGDRPFAGSDGLRRPTHRGPNITVAASRLRAATPLLARLRAATPLLARLCPAKLRDPLTRFSVLAATVVGLPKP